METFLIYLIKASSGILLFYLFYFLVLRKETFYASNRIYLISGLILAILLPAFPISYTTAVALVNNSEFFTLGESPVGEFLSTTNSNSEMISFWSGPLNILSLIYIIGSGIFLLRLVLQTVYVAIQLNHGEKMHLDGVTVINIQRKIMPFSFFNAVIINIQEYSTEELSNIIAHEKVHIQERHWVDLLIVELLTVVFWINPIVWLYEKSIKQNHEYLADQGVLRAGYHPGQYQALLINQLMGVKILGFTNNLNFSLNKKRIEMMKKEKSPGFKKVKLLIALPVVAILIFAFAKPEFVVMEVQNENSTSQENPSTKNESKNRAKDEYVKIKGKVVNQDDFVTVKGKVVSLNKIPLEGANVILKSTNRGTVTDDNGEFEIDIPNGGTLVISYIGYETTPVTVTSSGETAGIISVKMKEGVYHMSLPKGSYYTTSPNLSKSKLAKNATPPPLKSEYKEYKEKMKIVEELPNYIDGGAQGLANDIEQSTKEYVKIKGEKGSVKVSMLIDVNGNVSDFRILASENSKLNGEAIRILKELNNWTPGIQRGKKVPVNIAVPINFN